MKSRSQTERLSVGQGKHALGAFLAKRLGISGRKAKALLDDRRVFVNGKRSWMAKYVLKKGDVVEVSVQSTKPHGSIDVLWRGNDLLVVNKPAGLLAVGKGSVEEVLRVQLKKPDLAAVHRLDRDTTGCLLMALTDRAKGAMIEVFKNDGITKVYEAIVAGRLSKEEATLATPLGGKRAVSYMRAVSVSGGASHVRVRIDTGRTHQIRKHLQAAGNPVLGDKKYGAGGEHNEKLLRVPRQMLHARALSFENPSNGKPVRVTAPWPSDFKACLKAFKLT